MADETVLVPIPLTCFALTEQCCDTSNTFRIAPITQPNYTFMRLGDHLIEPDIQDPVDLHSTQPWNLNSRLADLGSGGLLEHRLGIYVHWTIPQLYRMGYSAAGDAAKNPADQADRQRRAGFPPDMSKPVDATDGDVTGAPQFRPVPNVWIIIRRLDMTSMIPATAPMEPLKAWVILSDALRSINLLGDDVDVEFDVSPFINGSAEQTDARGGTFLEGQAENFLGMKLDFEKWADQQYDSVSSIRLTTMSSANPLFADFTNQNMNVFTMADDFAYPDKTNPTGTSRLTSATADYFVIGFHKDENDDPFTTTAPPTTTTSSSSNSQLAKEPTNADRLDTCNMTLKQSTGNAKAWLSLDAHSRVICHASMYNVKFDRKNPPTTVLAQKAAENLLQQPIAVGVSPMDALLAYSRAHHDSDSDQMSEIEKDLQKWQSLFQGKDSDDVDGLQAAVDEQFELAFQKINAGVEYKLKQFSATSAKPAVATTQQIQDLQKLNIIQRALDAVQREKSFIAWKLFATWWEWMNDIFADPHIPEIFDGLTAIKNKLAELNTIKTSISSLNGLIMTATSDRFYQRKDPTLLFGNISKGWDADFSDKIPVRLSDQVMHPPTESVGWDGKVTATQFFDTIRDNKRIPSSLKTSIRALLAEFLHLRPANVNDVPSGDEVMPYYHEEPADPSTTQPTSGSPPIPNAPVSSPTDSPAAPASGPSPQKQSKDRWNNTQPWRPIFVEWEAKYYHIPYDKWDFGVYNRKSNWNAAVAQYAVDEVLAPANQPVGTTTAPTDDIRVLTGRNYLVPQGPSTFRTMIQQIFDNTNPEDLESQISQADRDNLLNDLANVDIVSFPLTGLTTQLLTQFEGSHVNPLVRLPGKQSKIIDEARDNYADAVRLSFQNAKRTDVPNATLLEDIMLQMDSSTSQTPLGNLPIGETLEPMKPVTHGQFAFTQINIIDKFGQAISIVNPEPWLVPKNPPITPCLSDTYYPGTIGQADPNVPGTLPNVIVPAGASCPFLSLTPSINQPARLNAQFMIQDKDDPKGRWRSCTDWDDPIVGWLVVNYADQGIQIFLKDGTFYREIREGGRQFKATGNTTAAPKWLPFEQPDISQKASTSAAVQQLDSLIAQMSSQSYFQGLVNLLNQATDTASPGKTLPPAPPSYAAYTSILVGKPVAIVNAGWSLELSTAENTNWSTLSGVKTPSRTLLQPQSGESWPGAEPGQDMPKTTSDGGYHFKVKIGDAERNFDGLLGLFVPSTPVAGQQRGETDFSKIYTYLTDQMAATGDPRVDLNPKKNTPGTLPLYTDKFPTLTPYYIDPAKQTFTNGVPDPLQGHDSKLRMYTLLMDPFLPVHAYTSILPNNALQLPTWTIENSLKKMTAFWRIGPILVADDVPSDTTWIAANPLKDDYVNQLQVNPNDNTPRPAVTLPIASGAVANTEGQGAALRYLQPYWIDLDATNASGGAASGSSKPNPKTYFCAVDVLPDTSAAGTELKMQDGPYTMIEGYLQMAKPISTVAQGS